MTNEQLESNIRLAVLSCNVTLDHCNKVTSLIMEAVQARIAELEAQVERVIPESELETGAEYEGRWQPEKKEVFVWRGGDSLQWLAGKGAMYDRKCFLPLRKLTPPDPESQNPT